MNFGKVVKKVAKKAKVHPIEVDAILRQFTETVKDHVAAGEVVSFKTFGRWEPTHKKARTSNLTDTPVPIPARIVPQFYPTKTFKVLVRGLPTSEVDD